MRRRPSVARSLRPPSEAALLALLTAPCGAAPGGTALPVLL